MNDPDLKSFYAARRKPTRPANETAPMPMHIFLRHGSMLCVVMLMLLFVICWEFTNGLWPVGVKRYALFGLMLMFMTVRYLSGPAQFSDKTQFAGSLSVLQIIIVIVVAICTGPFLGWFFHG